MFSVCRQYTTCSEHARATDRQIARKKERRTSSREWTKIMTVNLPRRNFWKVAFKTRNFQKCWPLNFRVSYLGSDDDTPTETNFNYIYPSVPIVLYYIPYNIIIEHDNRCDCQQKYRRKIGVFPRCLTFDSNRQISSPPFPIHPNFNFHRPDTNVHSGKLLQIDVKRREKRKKRNNWTKKTSIFRFVNQRRISRYSCRIEIASSLKFDRCFHAAST